MYTYTQMQTCRYVCRYVYAYTRNMFLCIYVWTCVYMYKLGNANMYTYIDEHVCRFVSTYECISIYT